MVFISGNIEGSYRAQNIIKVLSDNKFRWVYIPWFLLLEQSKITKFMSITITLLLFLPVRLVLIASSKKLIVLPMNFGPLLLLDMLVAKIFRREIIFDYYISLYDTTVNDRKIVKLDSLREKYVSWLEKKLTRWADVIVCLNNSEANYYKKYMCSCAKNKIKIIPLVVDRVSSRNIDTYITSETFNICWWGTYIPLHGLDKLIEAFSLVEENNVKLYIFGDYAEKAKPYVELVERLDICEKVIFNHEYTFRNRKLPEFLNNKCDLALGNFGDSEKANTVLVNKLVDALALGIPCMTMETGACNEFLDDRKNIILTKRSPSIQQILDGFEFVLNNKREIRRIGSRGLEVYNREFCPEIFSERYLKLLNNV
ncbi:glycosyltransferase [Vibrio breoganii]|uniref:glycosyltransferase n=1 Tax=Vibrio breoganii TaxID=553239 RepID=UPI000C823D09|nr:glycosyltransferase [Vibrio breoganii]PMM49036.1 hypothetical protein BCT52_03790 [Vibrio breoganii]